MAYLQEVASKGVTNMEMEALVFAALTHLAGIRSAVVCVTLLDRLKGDQVRYITIKMYDTVYFCFRSQHLKRSCWDGRQDQWRQWQG